MSVRIGWLVVALLLVCTAAHAQDRWSDPLPGVRLLTRTAPGPIEVRAASVDRCAPGVTARVTRTGDRGMVTSAFARAYDTPVAMNAGGFAPVGLTVGDGVQWPDSGDDGRLGFVGFGDGLDVRVSVPTEVRGPRRSETGRDRGR